jgi:phage repressor protein C with HTH and peptisase S24 domain
MVASNAAALSFTEVAERAGVSIGTVTRLAKAEPKRIPTYATAEAIGRALGDVAGSLRAAGYAASDSDLQRVGEVIDARPYVAALRMVSDASAGIERYALADASEDMSAGLLAVKAVRVRGDCLAPMLRDGDIMLVLPPESVRDGDLVIALLDFAQVVAKRFRMPASSTTRAAATAHAAAAASGLRVAESPAAYHPMPSYLETASGERVAADRFDIVGVVKHVIMPADRLMRE